MTKAKSSSTATSDNDSVKGLDIDAFANEARKAADAQYDRSKEFLANSWGKISNGLSTEKEYLDRINDGIDSSIKHSVDVNSKWIEFFHDMIRERIAVSAKIMRLREPKEQIELELEFARSSFTNYVDLTQKIFDETKGAIESSILPSKK